MTQQPQTEILTTSRRPSMPAGVLTSIDPGFAGELIDPDHPDYDRARRLDNDVFHKRPALIARCTSAADVQIASTYSGEHDLIVAVRGGRHSIPGHSSCDEGLVIDTGPMKRIEIDPESRTGRFSAGLTWAELYAVGASGPRSCSWMGVSWTSKIAHQTSAA